MTTTTKKKRPMSGFMPLRHSMPRLEYLKIMREAWRAGPMRAESKKGYYNDANSVASRARWVPHEDKIVLDMATTDKEIAARLGRSTKAIELRRCKLRREAGIPPGFKLSEK